MAVVEAAELALVATTATALAFVLLLLFHKLISSTLSTPKGSFLASFGGLPTKLHKILGKILTTKIGQSMGPIQLHGELL
jgi:hypothetical protein